MKIVADFLWSPNWSGKVVERLEWLTDVQQSSNGTEVRNSLREMPRTSISFEVVAEGVEAQKLKNFIRVNQGKSVMLPWWPGGFKKWEVFPLFGWWLIFSNLGLRPQDLGFSGDQNVAGKAIFFNVNTGQHDVQNVTVTNALSLTITGGNNYPIGSMVYPLVEARLSSAQTLEHPTDGVTRMQVVFHLENPLPVSGSTNLNPWTPVGETTSKGVFTDVPNRANDVTEDFERMVQELDFQTGKKSFSDRSKQSFAIRSHEYLYQSRKDLYFFRNFIHLLQGRYAEFHVPTWQNDVTGIEEDDPYSGFYALDAGQAGMQPLERPNHLIALGEGIDSLPIEDLVMQQVSFYDVSWVPDGQLYVEPNIFMGNPTLTRNRIKKCSWLERVRLNSDAIEIVWESSEVCTVSLSLRSIRRV